LFKSAVLSFVGANADKREIVCEGEKGGGKTNANANAKQCRMTNLGVFKPALALLWGAEKADGQKIIPQISNCRDVE